MNWENIVFPSLFLCILIVAFAIWRFEASQKIICFTLLPLAFVVVAMLILAMQASSSIFRVWGFDQTTVWQMAKMADREIWPGGNGLDWHIVYAGELL